VLGSGGQGIVYAAYDPRLCRDVALKVLSAATLLSPSARERFRREALTASRLHDPGLCTVLDAGETAGQAYIVMRRIAGVSLAKWILAQRGRQASPTGAGRDNRDSRASGNSTDTRAERRRRVDRVLQWFEDVARALHKAHAAGIVHRDIKP